MVCTPAALEPAALDRRGTRELGDRVVRVSAPGAGEPHRSHAAAAGPAQDSAGSHHAKRVRAVCGPLYEGTGAAQLPLGRPVPLRGRVLRVPALGCDSSSFMVPGSRKAAGGPFWYERRRVTASGAIFFHAPDRRTRTPY